MLSAESLLEGVWISHEFPWAMVGQLWHLITGLIMALVIGFVARCNFHYGDQPLNADSFAALPADPVPEDEEKLNEDEGGELTASLLTISDISLDEKLCPSSLESAAAPPNGFVPSIVTEGLPPSGVKRRKGVRVIDHFTHVGPVSVPSGFTLLLVSESVVDGILDPKGPSCQRCTRIESNGFSADIDGVLQYVTKRNKKRKKKLPSDVKRSLCVLEEVDVPPHEGPHVRVLTGVSDKYYCNLKDAQAMRAAAEKDPVSPPDGLSSAATKLWSEVESCGGFTEKSSAILVHLDALGLKKDAVTRSDSSRSSGRMSSVSGVTSGMESIRSFQSRSEAAFAAFMGRFRVQFSNVIVSLATVLSAGGEVTFDSRGLGLDLGGMWMSLYDGPMVSPLHKWYFAVGLDGRGGIYIPNQRELLPGYYPVYPTMPGHAPVPPQCPPGSAMHVVPGNAPNC